MLQLSAPPASRSAFLRPEGLPPHLLGTRAALFHLWRQGAFPAPDRRVPPLAATPLRNPLEDVFLFH